MVLVRNRSGSSSLRCLTDLGDDLALDSDSDAVEDFDTSLGSSRAGYYKFRIADFMGGKATAIDIADFDNAWHELLPSRG